MGIIERVFADADWREDLDEELVNKLDRLLRRTKTYEDAYQRSDHPAMAQMWVAVAELFYTVDRVNARVRKLEKRMDALIDAVEEAGLEDEELRESLENY